MKKKSNKLFFAFIAFSTALAIYSSIFLLVDNELSADDIASIKKLDVKKQCSDIKSYSGQIDCVSAVHKSMRRIVTDYRCAPRFSVIEPKYFLERGHGCCYDRARFTEKALEYYGLETRHVFLIEKKFPFLNAIIPGLDSHASTEVKTSKGWLGLDPNEDFILLTYDNLPLSYAEAMKNLEKVKYTMKPEKFYRKDIQVYYGLHSRHGFFHGLHFPGPEFNIQQIKYNF